MAQPSATEKPLAQYKVWVDRDLCSCGGLCEEIVGTGKVFFLKDDGLAYTRNPDGSVPEGLKDEDTAAFFFEEDKDKVVEAYDECPTEAIIIEAIGISIT